MAFGGLDGEAASRLFSDTIDVLGVNPDGKKFDKVDRIVGKSHECDVDVMLDVANEPFPVRKDEKLVMLLTTTLRRDGKPEEEWDATAKADSLLDDYEYGMHGKVFKVEHTADGLVGVLVSFGGLLLVMKGRPEHLKKLSLDQRIFLLAKKGIGVA